MEELSGDGEIGKFVACGKITAVGGQLLKREYEV